jgi:DNA-directed RNA polymerase subunit RPC12/RpoP
MDNKRKRRVERDELGCTHIYEWDEEEKVLRYVCSKCGQPFHVGAHGECADCINARMRDARKPKPMSDGDTFARSF